MSELNCWYVAADRVLIASGLTWEDAVQLTFDAANTGMYTDVHIVSSHAAKFYVDMEKFNELET